MTNRQSAPLTILRDCNGYALEIATTVREAFRARYGTGDGEAAMVEGLRADGDVIAELTGVENGEVVGHAMFSRMAADPHLCRVAALGPVCTRIDRQRSGIGTALIRTGLAMCAENGVGAVFVLGDPLFYARFGFSVAIAAPTACAYSGPHLQAVELRAGAPGSVKSVAYAPAFAAV